MGDDVAGIGAMQVPRQQQVDADRLEGAQRMAGATDEPGLGRVGWRQKRMVRAHHLEHALLVRAEEVADAPDLAPRDAPFLPHPRPRGVYAADDHLTCGLDRAE